MECNPMYREYLNQFDLAPRRQDFMHVHDFDGLHDENVTRLDDGNQNMADYDFSKKVICKYERMVICGEDVTWGQFWDEIFQR